MDDIPAIMQSELEARVREQIEAEACGDVTMLYEFTLPAIRAKRIAEHDDEPEQSLSEIRAFAALVWDAELESVQVEQFSPTVERFSGCPAAIVITRVRYNRQSNANQFRCIWVRDNGKWFSTALSKMIWPESGHHAS